MVADSARFFNLCSLKYAKLRSRDSYHKQELKG